MNERTGWREVKGEEVIDDLKERVGGKALVLDSIPVVARTFNRCMKIDVESEGWKVDCIILMYKGVNVQIIGESVYRVYLERYIVRF